MIWLFTFLTLGTWIWAIYSSRDPMEATYKCIIACGATGFSAVAIGAYFLGVK